MSVEALAIVLNHSQATGAVKLILLGIANHINPDNDGAWPSQEKLAGYANCSDRYVRDAIAELVKLGELHFESRAGNSKTGNRPNRYWLTLTCPADCDGSVNHRRKKQPELSAQTTGTLSQSHRNPTSAEPLREPEKEPIRRATKIDSNFQLTQEQVDWFVEAKLPIDPNFETQRFIDYYLANGKVMKDWSAAWRNWMRKAVEYQKTPWDKAKDIQAQESRLKTEIEKQHTQQELKDMQEAREAATAPPKCEHDKILALCLPCLRKGV